MNENQLIPLDKQSFAKISKKNKIPWGRIFLTLIFVSLLLVAIINFKSIIAFFENTLMDKTHDSVPSPPTSENDNNESNNNVQSPPNDSQIPKDNFQIIEKSFEFSQIKNNTAIEIESMDFSPISAKDIYSKFGNEAPVVLVIHSASQEAYSNGVYYSKNDDFYSSTNNVGDIGKIICEELNDLNINAIHINEVYANGGKHSSTKEYESKIASILSIYPSIEYVINISRDIIVNEDFTMTKPITISELGNMAQLKITVGSSANKDFWKKNLSLAIMLATSNASSIYEVELSPFELSQNISPCSLKVDIGAFSNSFHEASCLARSFAHTFASLIN